MFNLRQKKITIIGAKRSGMALARLVLSAEGIPKISELCPPEDISKEVHQWLGDHQVEVQWNGHTQNFIEDSDLIVLSPGVRQDIPVLLGAKKRGLPILGEIEFAYQFCTKPIIAISGSNGKTTVSTLTHQILEEAGHRSILCGNIGFPFSEAVSQISDKEYVVLEMSSFQSESILDPQSPYRQKHNGRIFIRGFRPHVAVILNFSQNHLDRHKDLEEYLMAKKRMCINQTNEDFVVLNYQSELLRNIANTLNAQAVYFNDVSSENTNPNLLACLAISKTIHIKPDVCRRVFEKFKGVEHRLEWVRTINGVDFINDSKATTAEATRWALTNIKKPILMICGGKDKNIDYSVLSQLVQQRVKKMFVLGEAKTKISRCFNGLIQIEETASLEEAVNRARANAQTGDCVLLSPMCASFDMFQDFEHRGRVFKDIVNHLQEKQQGVLR